MTFPSNVPGDVEPDSFLDLADDCREVASVLAPYVIDLRTLPEAGPAPALFVPAGSAEALDGYEAYGS